MVSEYRYNLFKDIFSNLFPFSMIYGVNNILCMYVYYILYYIYINLKKNIIYLEQLFNHY